MLGNPPKTKAKARSVYITKNLMSSFCNTEQLL